MENSNPMNGPESKRPLEVRVALTVKDLPKLTQLFQAAFGLDLLAEWHNEGGNGVIFKIENATLELLDEAQTEFVDRTEVGKVSGQAAPRLALQVANIKERGQQLADLGSTPLNSPVTTPWGDFNWRFAVDDKLQITLFQTPE